jgi:hypothetical protein
MPGLEQPLGLREAEGFQTASQTSDVSEKPEFNKKISKSFKT